MARVWTLERRRWKCGLTSFQVEISFFFVRRLPPCAGNFTSSPLQSNYDAAPLLSSIKLLGVMDPPAQVLVNGLSHEHRNATSHLLMLLCRCGVHGLHVSFGSP